MIPKIDKFGVVRPLFRSFTSNRFEKSFRISSDTTCSSDCFACPEKATKPTQFRHVSSGDGIYGFKSGWSSTEFTSECSIDSLRATINDMLTKDIFGYNGKRKRNPNKKNPRKLPNDRNSELNKNNARRQPCGVSSNERSPACASRTDYSSFGFLDDLFDESSIEFIKNLPDPNVLPLNDDMCGSSQIQRSKKEKRAECTPNTVGQSWSSCSSASGSSQVSNLSSKSAPIPIRNNRTLTIVEMSSDEGMPVALALCGKQNDDAMIETPKMSRNSLRANNNKWKRDNRRPMIDEVVDSDRDTTESSNRNDGESDDIVGISQIVHEYGKRFLDQTSSDTSPEATASSHNNRNSPRANNNKTTRDDGRLMMVNKVSGSMKDEVKPSNRSDDENENLAEISRVVSEYQKRFPGILSEMVDTSPDNKQDSVCVSNKESKCDKDGIGTKSNRKEGISHVAAEFRRAFPHMFDTSPKRLGSSNDSKTLTLTRIPIRSNGFKTPINRKVCALPGKMNYSKRFQPPTRKLMRYSSNVNSRERSFKQNMLYGAKFTSNVPAITVSDSDEPERLLGQTIGGNDNTMIVPFRTGNNRAEIDFNAEVQSIIREFHRRVKPVA